ncbi:MAG: hypothetical protein ABIR26_00970, partial [Ramlibacter sp.]
FTMFASNLPPSRFLQPPVGAGAKIAVAATVLTLVGLAWSGTKHASHTAVSHAQQQMFPEPPAVSVAHAKEQAGCAAPSQAGG